MVRNIVQSVVVRGRGVPLSGYGTVEQMLASRSHFWEPRGLVSYSSWRTVSARVVAVPNFSQGFSGGH